MIGCRIHVHCTEEARPGSAVDMSTHGRGVAGGRCLDGGDAHGDRRIGAGEDAGDASRLGLEGAKARLEIAVLHAVERVEIGGGAKLAGRSTHCNFIQFAFLQVAARHGAILRQKGRVAFAEFVHGLQEGIARRANEIVQNEARALFRDVGDNALDGGFLERQIAFAEHGAAGIGDKFTRQPVHFPAPDIVRPHEIGAGAVAGDKMFEEGDQVLVRTAADIDDVLIGLEAFIRAHVPQEAVVFLDQRQHFLARGGGNGADDVSAAAVADQAARTFQIGGEIGVGIEKDRLDAGATGISVFMEGEFNAVESIAAHGPVRPGRRIENADLHWVQHVLSKRKKPTTRVPAIGALWGDIAR